MNIHAFEIWLQGLSQTLPLAQFVFFGSLLEEIISPIPAYLVLALAGSVAFTRGYGWLDLGVLVVLAALGKTLGASVYYVVGDALEDLFARIFGKYFKTDVHAIEKFGQKFSGNHWKDGGMLFLLRAFPLTPTTPLSLACGVVKISFPVYFTATFFGGVVKDIFYISAGYFGIVKLPEFWKTINIHKGEWEVFLLVAFLVFVLWQITIRYKMKMQSL